MSGFLKFISPLVHPLGLAWLLLLLAAVLCAWRRRAWGTVVCVAAAAVLWFIAQPPVVEPLLRQLEHPWVEHTPAQAPPAEVVIVLGGGWRRSSHDFVALDLTAAADRWITGVELCRFKKIPVLVVGGDPVGSESEGFSVAAQFNRWLELWGLKDIRVETLGPVRTTRDEALRARRLVDERGWKSILLVTSACHMRRAVATFEKVGLKVQPVACDFQAVRNLGPPRWSVFPNEEALFGFGMWWHEQLGWLAYRLFGQV
jgi:uncharacterized SAM-binding protein YcdF (DUF218 family)